MHWPIVYKSQRTHRDEPPAEFDASYQAVGEPFRAQAGTLEHWLTARYCLYSADRRGNLFRVRSIMSLGSWHQPNGLCAKTPCASS